MARWRITDFITLGNLRASRYLNQKNNALRHRMIEWASCRGNTFWIARAIGSTPGLEKRYDGDRCPIAQCAPFSVSVGIRLIAVAPLPMTTIRFPVWSSDSGQCWG